MANNIVRFSMSLAQELFSSLDEMPVDFDLAWQWLGYATKQKAKDKLLSNFDQTLDFNLNQTVRVQNEGNRNVQRPYEQIVVTIDCFKQLGMMAGTDQGKQIRRYFLDCEKVARSSAVHTKEIKRSPYTDRLKELGESLKCPKGFWSVIQQSPALLMMVEKLYPVTDLQLLDGSIGIRWGSFRKGQSWAKDSSSANYTFSDHRGKVQIKAYANSELGYYRDWEEDVYVPKFLPVYLQERYKALVAK